MTKLDFSYDGLTVGYFEDERLPLARGDYRYMSYRGFGHLKMVESVRAGKPARCVAQSGDRRVEFLVARIPEHNVLSVIDVVVTDDAARSDS